MSKVQTVLVTGGAGYVGSRLVPKLLASGFHVKVLDLYIYGDKVLRGTSDIDRLEEIKGDIRNRSLLERIMPGCDAVIHLACISNDPSFDLDPGLGRSINYDAFFDIVAVAKKNRINRFIFASSSSVYGIKEELNVTEDLTLEPLTDYSKFKALCEEVLMNEREPGFNVLVLRPATVCGYAPRLRLDLTVNILTNHAVNNGVITVFGGQQRRPNIHIDDITDVYIRTLQWPAEAIDGKIFNVGYENHRIIEIAEIVQNIVGNGVEINITPTDDLRSYHISSDKIKKELGFVPKFTIQMAVQDLADAFQQGNITNSMDNHLYYNIKTMKTLELS